MSEPLQDTPALAPGAEPRTWPPLVGSDRVPRLVRLRDLLLTLLAWCAFSWMLRDAIALAIDWLREPFGQLTNLQEPDWPRVWQRLHNYLKVAGLLAAWLGFWAVYRSKILRTRGKTQKAPAPLADAVLCQRYGVALEQLQAWRAQPVVTVDVAEDGRISDAAGASGDAAWHAQ